MNLLELRPLDPYEQYMRTAGASREQRGVQTGEAHIQAEVQCDAIECETRWTQAPPKDDLLLGWGTECIFHFRYSQKRIPVLPVLLNSTLFLFVFPLVEVLYHIAYLYSVFYHLGGGGRVGWRTLPYYNVLRK